MSRTRVFAGGVEVPGTWSCGYFSCYTMTVTAKVVVEACPSYAELAKWCSLLRLAVHHRRALVFSWQGLWLATFLPECDSGVLQCPFTEGGITLWNQAMNFRLDQYHPVTRLCPPDGADAAQIAVFEGDRSSWPVYHDWCLDNDWAGRAQEIRAEITGRGRDDVGVLG